MDTKKVVQFDNEIEPNLHANKKRLVWYVTNDCNYQCDYCYISRKAKIDKQSNLIDYSKIIEYADNFLGESGNEGTIILTGGEPSVHPNFLDIINNIKTSLPLTNVELVTNLSFTTAVLKKLTDLDILINASWHSTGGKKFINKVSKIPKKNMLSCSVLYDPANWEKCLEIYDELVKLHDCIKLTIASNTVYTDSQLAALNQRKIETDFYIYILTFDDGTKKSYTYQELVNLRLNNFSGWLCEAGRGQVTITPNGDIYACPNIALFQKPLFNVTDKTLHKYNPTICTYSPCNYGLDLPKKFCFSK